MLRDAVAVRDAVRDAALREAERRTGDKGPAAAAPALSRISRRCCMRLCSARRRRRARALQGVGVGGNGGR